MSKKALPASDFYNYVRIIICLDKITFKCKNACID